MAANKIAGNAESVVVKYRTVSVSIWQWNPKPHLTHWMFRRGRKHVSRSTFEKAKAAALEYAQETFLGAAKLGGLSDSQTRAIRRLLDEDATLASVDEFLAWRRAKSPHKMLADARREFLAAKLASQGRSKYHLEILRKHLSKLSDKPLGDFALADFPAIPGAARTRKNVIVVWRQFFHWCRKQEWLPYDQPTAADRLEIPATPRVSPATYSPAELGKLFGAVSDSYLPWLGLAAWAGIRSEELAPDPKSGKDALQWEDVHLARKIIIIRPEVSKTGHKRTIPICAALDAVLQAFADAGRICPALAPHTPQRGGVMAETTRIGKVIGGWRRNALRHSFISYRAAQVGLGQTAMEAGNSESEAKASYLDAMTKAEASAWFRLPKVLQSRLPATPLRVVGPVAPKSRAASKRSA
jgi:site-specific recombinase XerD